MAKLHMRCSIELDLPDDLFRKIVDNQLEQWKQCCDVEYAELPRAVQVMIETKQFEPCDWDDGGYVPQTWLEDDARHSGMYEHDKQYGIRRKENA